ncbi:MAG: T9SS type A sorting domain-containing protein [Candidatus Marinimicrobia bacterium]|nr:T9SS type A sorting domain-containing protein [Candidatus Neomarinimicrobiota bacterium]MDD9930899.1 T9SS type A sorting domain-containing protein [Candidatus Neomarinimicrobiota bacterium]
MNFKKSLIWVITSILLLVSVLSANPIQIGGDNFTFSTTKDTITAVVADDLKNINVFPNPYMGYHDSVLPLPKYVTFNHLPTTGKVVFRVFNMAGTMVAAFEKNTSTQHQKWDMRNSNNFPLASGVYVVHIDAENVGEKILKLAIVIEDEYVKRY